MARWVAVFLGIWGLSLVYTNVLQAQDMDDLFNQPDEVTEPTEDENESDTQDAPSTGEPAEGDAGAVDIAGLTTSPTTVSGRVTSSAGFGIGLIEWPWSAAADGESFRDLMRYDILYTTGASVSVDSRPQPYLRFRTTLSTDLNENSLRFTDPTVDELFVDYTFGDTVFVRAGRYGMTWGRGRLFDNPANLVDRVDEGAAVRATAPVGRGSFTGVLYSRKAWIDQYAGSENGSSTTNWRAFAGAGQWENTFGGVTAELSAHWQKDEPVGTAAGLTWGLRGLTLTAEGVYNLDQDDPDGGPGSGGNSVQALGNFLWESSSGRWSFWGEYQFDSAAADDDSGGEHLLGLAMRAPSLTGSGWRPGLRWRHAVEDTSGEVVAGISGTIAPSLDLSVGLPVIYGKPGSYFREALVSDNQDDDEDEDDLTPLDNVATVLLAVSLSFSF